jgi:hypothetical protein
MKRLIISLGIACLVLTCFGNSLSGREEHKRKDHKKKIPELNLMPEYTKGRDRIVDPSRLQTTASIETFVLGEFDFEGIPNGDAQGWFGVDITEQEGTFFHIDDFSGLNGGDYGGLVPIDGSQSLWCGARPTPSDPNLCGYSKLPGYGNGWDQRWESVEFAHSGDVTLKFKAHYDSEPGYDYTYVQYESKSDQWVTILTIDGDGDMTANEIIPQDSLDGTVRFRFRFQGDGAWSDQDGLWNTDGAIIIDSLLVSDTTGTLDYQDFETEAVGDLATADGDWMASTAPAYGDYAGIFPGINILQEDPCKKNLSFMWGFFNGSTADYGCAGHPEQPTLPYGKEVEGEMLYLVDEIWSPLIDWNHDIHGTPIPASAKTTLFEFDIYQDMQLGALIFWFYHARFWLDGCPMEWRDYGFVNGGSSKEWRRFSIDLDYFVPAEADYIQLGLLAVDMSQYWHIIYGTGECHGHSPLYDNVKLTRINISGPSIIAYDGDLFQDTFPGDGTVTGTGRIDTPRNRARSEGPTIRPADSLVVRCLDEAVGLLEPEPYTGFGSAVYCYVAVHPQDQPGKMGSAIEADNFRWPVVDSASIAGSKWYIVRMDTSFREDDGPRTGPQTDVFCVDLNDNLFESGDTLLFFFEAENTLGDKTYWTRSLGLSVHRNQAATYSMEMQILPAGGLSGTTDILYVDHFDGLGAQPYFDLAFEMMGIEPDRFDIRRPHWARNNGNTLDGAVSNVITQLIPYYKKIIWNTGGGVNYQGVLGNGGEDKTDDYNLLLTFLDNHTSTEGAGVYLSGDDIAEYWAGATGASAITFKTLYMNHSLVSGSHTTPVDYGLSPLVIGETGSMFDHITTSVDTMIAWGGCPSRKDFDVLEPAAGATLEMTYNSSGNPQAGAVVAQSSLNSIGNPVGVVLSGFSFHYIVDDVMAGIPDRTEHLTDILRWLGNELDDPVDIETTPALTNSLEQNFPNPFNPVTTIRYSIRQSGHVSLKIYDAAGRLVKTLVSEMQDPNAGGFTVTWDGKNNNGQAVSSGVYFYKLAAKEYSKTKKMVLLK